MSYQSVFQVSGTGPWMLAQGSDRVATYAHIAVEGSYTGSFILLQIMAGQTLPSTMSYTNFLNGQVQNAAITGGLNPFAGMARCDARLLLLTASAWTAGTASVYVQMTQGT